MLRRLFLFFSFCLLSVSAQVVIPEDLQEGLVSFYPFSGNANDMSDNGYHGVVYDAELTEDRYGNTNSAYLFSESSIKIEDLLINTQNNFSISCWVNFNDLESSNQTLLNSIPHIGFSISFNYDNSGQLGMFTGNPDEWLILNDIGTNVDFQMNQWYHLLFIKNGNQYLMYIDGNLYNTASLMWTPVYTGSSDDFNYGLRIGAIGSVGDMITYSGGYENFSGKIDDVVVWNVALNEDQIGQIVNIETPESESECDTGDINCDGEINVEDAALILQYIVGIIDTLPSCE